MEMAGHLPDGGSLCGLVNSVWPADEGKARLTEDEATLMIYTTS